MNGFEQLLEIVSPSGFVAMPADELRSHLSMLGYLNEWLLACQAAADRYGYSDSYEDLDAAGRYRNQLFLDAVAKDMGIELACLNT